MKAAPMSLFSAPRNRRKASTPPAEAPTPTSKKGGDCVAGGDCAAAASSRGSSAASPFGFSARPMPVHPSLAGSTVTTGEAPRSPTMGAHCWLLPDVAFL